MRVTVFALISWSVLAGAAIMCAAAHFDDGEPRLGFINITLFIAICSYIYFVIYRDLRSALESHDLWVSENKTTGRGDVV